MSVSAKNTMKKVKQKMKIKEKSRFHLCLFIMT